MTERDSDTPQQRRWLEGAQIDFDGERPKTSLKLVVAVDEKLSSCKIEERDAVRWKGKLSCSETSICSIKLYKKMFSGIPKLHAFVETPVVRVNGSSPEISLQDTKKMITIKLTFASELPGRRQEDGSQSVASASDAVDISLMRSHERDDILGKARSTRQSVDSAKAGADRQKVILDKLGRARSLIDAIKAVGTAVGDIHPAIGAAASALGLLIKVCEKQEACRDEAKKLMKELDLFLAIEKYIAELRDREETRLAVERMLDLIAQISDYVREHASNRLLATGNLLTGKYRKTLEDFAEEFASAKESFDRSIKSEIFRIVHDIEHEIQLQKLRAVDEAYYRSGAGHTCLPGTRRAPLDRYLRWMQGSGPEAELSWLYGFAGSGKSCVANTIAEAVRVSGFGLSCFFCKRDDPNLSKPERVLPTLASRFAKQYASFRGALLEILRSSNDLEAIGGDISKQFDLLFTRPLAKTADPFRPHIVVIDGLDECGTPQEQKVLAKHILALAKAAPWIKVFVTSRAEPGISDVFQSSPDCFATDLRTEAETDTDVRQYMVTKLGELGLRLQDDQIALLVQQAAGLFIWCTTLFSYLMASLDPENELQPFLGEASQDSRHSHRQLYALYDQIISSAVKNQRDMPFLRTVLGIVYVTAALRPLPITGIAHSLQSHEVYKGRSKTAVGNAIRALHAVLHVDALSHDTVRVYHTSFLDFLQDRLEHADGWERPKMLHAIMSKSCLLTMDQQLRFNICELGGAPVLNKDIRDLDKRIAKSISQELQYSVEFLFDHLLRSGSVVADEDLLAMITLFSTTKVLFWLEVMSLLNLVSRSVDMLRSSSHFFQTYPKLSFAVSDLEKLVSSFSEAFASTPHIYLSVLPWLPRKSRTYEIMATSFRHLPLITGKDDDWRASIWTKTAASKVLSVAYSPNDRLIVSGSGDGEVCLWDAHTGAAVGEPLRGHEDGVTSVTFSPNGRYIVSGSRDCTIRVWDAQTRAPFGEPLRGHESWVTSVAYSPNGSHIASGSRDCTIRVWDAQTGATVGGPFQGHENFVTSVEYSPDGLCIASGSDDGTVRVWAALTGAAVGEPLRGHERAVTSLTFSPDGRCIISGSRDCTIRVWDIQTGAAISEPFRGHENWVTSVAFSPDGRCIVSGSDDGTMRVWDALTGAAVGEPLRGHERAVNSIAISSDGRHIVSGSRDCTIRVWDAHTDAAVTEPLWGHEAAVTSVAFSPDGNRIISASRDLTIRVWNAHSGAPIGEPLRGHTFWITSVAFSPDGRCIVSGSNDGTVRVWDAHTGGAVGEPLRGHENWVTSAACSPDGLFIVSGSDDGSVCVWDARTGAVIGEPLRGHGRAVNSVAFSPDGRHFVSGSRDCTIRLWDMQKGAGVSVPLRGHENWVASVAYSSDGCRIVSGSYDCMVRVWDVRTGAAIGEPLGGHEDGVTSVAFSPDSRCIVSGSRDCTIRVWDSQTGAAIGEPLRGHENCVTSVAFSPDGRYIVSGSDDGTVRVWDAHTYTPVDESFRGYERAVDSVAFAPDDSHSASGSDDGTMRVWGAHRKVEAEQMRQDASKEKGTLFDGQYCGIGTSIAHGERSLHEKWLACRSRLEETDAWVKDEDTLLLWIPYRYRPLYRRQVVLVIGTGGGKPPVVYLDKLYAYSGSRWTEIYDE